MDGSQVGGAAPTVPPFRSTVSPGKDFYTYVNGNWQHHVNIPPFAGSFGISEEIENCVKDVLFRCIHKLMRNDSDHPISLLAKSVLNPHVQGNNVRDLRHMLHTYDCMRTTEDVAREIGKLNRIQVRAPISFTVNPDAYKSGTCRVHMYEPLLGLPSKHHYQSGARNRVILQYGSLLRKVSELLETEALDAVIPIETSLLSHIGKDLTPEESHVAKTLVELEKEFKYIPWSPMLLAWGLPTDILKKTTFVLTNVDYIEALNRMFRDEKMGFWRTWLRTGLVLSFLEYLPPPFDDIHYELYGRKLRGNSQKLPQKLLMLRVLQTFAKQALSRLFVEEAVPEQIKDDAITMVRRLKRATVHRVKGIPWMVEGTKQIAIQKVQAMRFQVAYPSVWYNEFSSLIMDPERMLHNIKLLAAKDTDRMIRLIGPGCGESDGTWEDGAFEVNAYYYPDRNKLVVPAGMLRAPFFDLRKSAAWNYGAIGSAVGHEITHGFDDDGRTYDVHGSYKEWWTATDNRMYKKMTKALIDLYDGEDYLGGRVDGTLTLSENIADLGGVSISLDALREYLTEKKVSPKERLKAYRDFFVSYAVSWRNKDRPKKARQSLYLDVHAPAPLRVNMIVRQFQEFYDAFGLGPDSPGWIPKEDRIQLW
jgi:putative endopeptidase